MAKRKIQICLGSSCFSRGNNVNLNTIKKFLKKNNLEVEVEFSGHLCGNICNRGPVITIDDHVYEDVNRSRLDKILQEEFPC